MYKTASQIADAVLQKVALSPGFVARTLGKHIFDVKGGVGKGLLEMQTRFPRAVNVAQAVNAGGKVPQKTRTILSRAKKNLASNTQPSWKNRRQYGSNWKNYYRDLGKSSPEMGEFLNKGVAEGRGISGKNMMGLRDSLKGGGVPQTPRTVDLPPPVKTQGSLSRWWGQRSGVEKGMMGAGAGLGTLGLGYGMLGGREEEKPPMRFY